VSAQAASTTALSLSPAALAPLPSAPSGFNRGPAAPDTGGGVGGLLLDGLSFASSLGLTYDSNVSQGYVAPGGAQGSDVYLSLGGAANYQSKASEVTFGGNYHGTYNQYFQNTEFSGYSQGAGVSAAYDVGRLNVTGQVGIDYDHGSNRNYSSTVVDQTSFNSSLTARYKLSPKTSLTGNLSERFNSSSGDFNQTNSFDMGASALWKYSPLTEFGPGIRYTFTSDGTGDGRTSIGPTITANYKLSTKISLNSRVGMDFATYGDGASADPTFSTSLALDYRASKLWGMNLSLYRDTQADPNVSGGYYEVTALRLGYNRKIRRAVLNLGCSYETTSYSIPVYTGVVSGSTPIPPPQQDRNYLSLDSSLGMMIFHNTTAASVFLRYTDQSGGGLNSWNSVQTGISISRSF